MSASIAQNTRILIVGSGLTGSLTCYHLRALAKQKKIVLPILLDVADMARGPGGRMSTTRYGTNNNNLQQANTGAQYLSTSSSKSAALLESMCVSSSSRTTTTTTTTTKTKTPQCHLDRVEDPVRRSTHFIADSDDAYTHWLPRDGATNSVVKQFLRGGEPDRVIFGSRLQQMVIDSSSSTSTIPQLLPLYDSGGTGSSTYDIVILAMPPKDIIKFFNDDKKDPQSQADLHRRTNNRGKKRRAAITPNQRAIVLPNDVLRRLRTPSYVGRYSLALWLHDDDTAFANKAQHAFSTQRCNNDDPPSPSPSHPVLDMVSSQEGGRVLVAQSTVKLWRRLTNTRGGGRHVAKSSLLEALERLTGDTLPRVKHTKLLNWRTSQVVNSPETTGEGIVTAEGGRLIFTGDWCYESSFEGCNLAAEAAAIAAVDTIRSMTEDGSGLKAR